MSKDVGAFFYTEDSRYAEGCGDTLECPTLDDSEQCGFTTKLPSSRVQLRLELAAMPLNPDCFHKRRRAGNSESFWGLRGNLFASNNE